MRKSLADRFWSKVRKTDTCWLWLASTDKDGYGQIMVRRDDDSVTMAKAHTTSLKLVGINVPEGSEVCHRCNTPPCVRPDHLYIGTRRTNCDDVIASGSQRGERNPFARLDTGRVMAIRWLRTIGLSLTDIAYLFDVHFVTVSNIANRKTWKHVH